MATKISFKNGSVIKLKEERDEVPILLVNGEMLQTEDHFFRMGKLLGYTEEELLIQWQKLEIYDTTRGNLWH